MPIVQPASPRHSIEHLGSSLRIVIPSRKNWFIIPFLGFWIAGWSVGEVFVGGLFLNGLLELLRSPGLRHVSKEALGVGVFLGVFLLAWLGGWSVLGAFAIYAFLWQLTGKELIKVTPDSITITRKVLFLSRSKTYLAEHIKELRISPSSTRRWFRWSNAAEFWGLPDGLIAFDYGAKTIRFGSGIDEAEAKQIFQTIRQQFPQY